MAGRAALSARERKELHKLTPKAPRRPKGEPVVRVSAEPASIREEEMDGRDGLLWLGQKRRLKPEQLAAAFHYSDRARDAGDVSVRSCLDVNEGRGSSAGGELPAVSQSTAKRELFVIRWQVLRGVEDMLTVMDGVCAGRQTLRYLAGGDKHRARDLEVTLKCALDQIAAWLKEPKQGA